MSKSYRNINQDDNSPPSNNRGGKANSNSKFRGKNSRRGRESLSDLEDDSLQEMFASRFDCND